jgi:hypothetical protein
MRLLPEIRKMGADSQTSGTGARRDRALARVEPAQAALAQVGFEVLRRERLDPVALALSQPLQSPISCAACER